MRLAPRRAAILGIAALVWISAPAADAQYRQTNLVSDGSVPAAFTDPNLINPWGISFSATSPFWISDQGSNFKNPSTGNPSAVTTLYDSSGSPQPLIVNVPNRNNAPADPAANGPTGQVSPGAPGLNPTTATDFLVAGPNGGTAHTANFIFANQDGSISAWSGANGGTPIANTTATIEATVAGASFTGLAIANNPGAAVGGASGIQLYAADQNSGSIDVFNSSWGRVGTLVDPNGLPAGFTAFNVQRIGDVLFATYANQSNPFGGIVDEFNPDGTFIKRLIDDSAGNPAHGHLDQPWGVALAPATFGQFGGDLLVGNNGGDGWINAFSPTTGALVGSISLGSSGFFHEGNLWALTFGNAGANGDPNTLYFTAGVNAAGTEGLFGSITPVPEPSSAVLAGVGGALAFAFGLRRRAAGRA
jgi:uncharacterized protein (TIGR03118 family)